MITRSFKYSNTIIFNATNIGYKYSGLGVYALKLLKKLAAYDHDLNFIVYLNKNAKNHIDNFTFPKNFKIKWVSSTLSPDLGFPAHLLRLIYSNYLSIKHLRYVQFNSSQLEISFFKKNQIVTIHDIIPIVFKQYHKKQSVYFKYVLKLGLFKAQKIITPSFHSKKTIAELYKISQEKIKVIYHGINDKPSGTQNSEPIVKGKYLLYVGRICKMKNINGLLNSFYAIRDKIEHSLVIVGDDEKKLAEEINAISDEQEFQSRIKFLKNVTEEDKNNLMKHASLFIFPSLYEGFGFPPLEAMANGCPVIISNTSSLPEICEDTAIYINPNNHAQIAAEIVRVLNDEPRMKVLKEESVLRAKLFTWEHSVTEHIGLFKAALAVKQEKIAVIQNTVLASSKHL